MLIRRILLCTELPVAWRWNLDSIVGGPTERWTAGDPSYVLSTTLTDALPLLVTNGQMSDYGSAEALSDNFPPAEHLLGDPAMMRSGSASCWKK